MVKAPSTLQGRTVAVISAGDMGAAISRMLRDGGSTVITCLAGRSALTRQRAAEAGMVDVPDLPALVQRADLVLSVLVPAEALPLARQVSEAMKDTGARPVYADLNAIAPRTVLSMQALFEEVAAPFVDGGIIGGPPTPGANTRIYCSGPETSTLTDLRACGLDIRVVGPRIGQASGLKMVYAASTKGVTALWTELLVAARMLGLDEALAAEFGMSRAAIAKQMSGGIPSMPRRARRWVGEMEEIAATFADLGLTANILSGAADMYRLVSATPLADQTSREPDPPLDTILDLLGVHAKQHHQPD